MTVQRYVNDITRRMFVATADENYILSRIAFLYGFDWDFFWLSLHALEKYFKATLLMNDKSPRNLGHNLVALHTKSSQLHPRLTYGPLQMPNIARLDWQAHSVEQYLMRLNELGDPNNRYGTYG